MNEYQLQVAVAQFLTVALDPERVRYTHLPLGEARDVRVGAKLKRMGLKPGWPDFIILRDHPREPIFIEMKAGRGALSSAQKELAGWFERHGFIYRVCRSLDDVIDVLRGCGVPTKARAA